jgi:hypothetical protein
VIKLHERRKNLEQNEPPSPVLPMSAAQDCGHPPLSVPCAVGWRGSSVHTIHNLHVWGNGEFSCHPSLLIPAKVWCRRLGWNRRWWRNQTVCNTGLSRWSALHRPSSESFHYAGGCASICAWRHKVSAQRFPSPISATNAQLARKQLSHR